MKRLEAPSAVSWLGICPPVGAFRLALLMIAATLTVSPSAQAQTYRVLHTFTGPDGAYPYAAVTMDSAGNLYGTTYSGGFTGGNCGSQGCGTVFKLTHHSAGWTLSTLYSFTGIDHNDGQSPSAPVTIGPDGALYGTSNEGGLGYGTVFRLTPPATFCRGFSCPWTETALYRFMGGRDGAYPGYCGLVFDRAGNLYGSTAGQSIGGEGSGDATVFELTPSGGGWVKTVLHDFGVTGGVFAGVIFDGAGNLYGTASGHNAVFELTSTGSGWQYRPIFMFNGSDGVFPTGGLAFDSSGNLYGTTTNSGGTIYQLRPSGGNWLLTTLYNFNAYEGPLTGPTLDAAGNVYGTVPFLEGSGVVYKVTYTSNGWQETNLTDVSFQEPIGGVILDAGGNIYGTEATGGSYGRGTVFEITP